jgi:hypothetical protein
MYRAESTASWTYSTATWRQANAATANQLNFVIGVAEDAVEASVSGYANSSTASVGGCFSGVGYDVTNAPYANTGACAVGSNFGGNLFVTNVITPAAGKHYLAWLEQGNAGLTCIFYGGSSPQQLGITGSLLA